MKSEKLQLKNKNWRKVKLGELLLEVESGGRPIGGTLTVFHGVPSIGAEHLDDNGGFDFSKIKYVPEKYYKNSSRGKVKLNDVLCVKDGATIGKVSRITKNFPLPEAMVNEHVFIVRSKQDLLDQVFLFYKLRTREGRKTIKNSVGGSAQGGLKKDFLDYWEIDLPSLFEQKRIVEILSAFDDKIEVNNKINKTLEEMAQAIFKEWFIKNQKSKTQPRLALAELGGVKNQKFWKTGKINDLVNIISGYPFSSRLYTKNRKDLGVVTIKNVQDGKFITVCDSSINEKDIPQNMNPECRIRDGDILLSLTGNVGRVCFVYGGEYLLNQRVAKLKPKETKDLAFCYFLFRQTSVQNQLINIAKGSAQPNLSPVETGKILLTIPPRAILDKFSELVGPIYKRLVQNKVENQKLAALRDLLLPKLMSGEIRV